jgi:hypothetical protein
MIHGVGFGQVFGDEQRHGFFHYLASSWCALIRKQRFRLS